MLKSLKINVKTENLWTGPGDIPRMEILVHLRREMSPDDLGWNTIRNWGSTLSKSHTKRGMELYNTVRTREMDLPLTQGEDRRVHWEGQSKQEISKEDSGGYDRMV
jgi:hypothetical protein